jgi:hypothetical protein
MARSLAVARSYGAFAEAELAALFHNGKEACPLRNCLEELGHPQPPNRIQTNTSTAVGIDDHVIQGNPDLILQASTLTTKLIIYVSHLFDDIYFTTQYM